MPKETLSLEELIAKYESTYEHAEIGFAPPQERLVDGFLAEKLQSIFAKMQDKANGGLECDWWTAIIGGEGVGKSTLAASMLWEYAQAAKLDFAEQLKKNVAFDEFDMLRLISQLDISSKYSFIWCDEGANIFFNRDNASVGRKYIIKFSNAMRFMRYFVAVCSVEASQLDTIIRNHRLKSLIRVEKQGVYHYFSHQQAMRLLLANQGRRDMQFNWRAVEPEHVGWFGYSPEIKGLVDALKRQYLERFKLETRMSYIKELCKKLDISRELEEALPAKLPENSIHDYAKSASEKEELKCPKEQ